MTMVRLVDDRLPVPVAARGRSGGPLPWPVAVPAAVAAGAGLLVAFPAYGWWWAAPVGVALLSAAAHRRRPVAGAGLGALTGAVFFTALLSWTNLHTGLLPWLLLSGLQTVFLGLLGCAVALVSPLVDRVRWVWAPVTGLLWVAQEAVRDRVPFGGFPWGRLAFSQDESPLLRLAAVGGAPLVTFGVALTGGLVLAGVWRGWRSATVADGLCGAALVVAAAGLLAGASVVPVTAPAGRAVQVAVVQGNVPRMGLDFNAQRRAVLDNHVTATVALAARVAIGAERQPDLVVWPENSSDIDPFRNPDAAAVISRAADVVRAPILVGAVLLGPGPAQARNTGLLWLPSTGPDTAQMYVKRHPVPFAEYVPLRRLARMVSTEVDRIRADLVAGGRPGVLRVAGMVVGDVICFEIADDAVVRDTVTGGAQVLVVQTNNATFDEAEARQQLAMVRLRAVEHGRTALMASTVGVSGFATADGRVSGATGFNTAAVVTRQVRLGSARTLATRLGVWPEVVLTGAAVVVLLAAARVRRRGGVTGGGPDAEER
jgi:apolipoprotein N-acyltransferase